ncbi:NnrS family protein [Phenylobacterium sp.]|uniref:NnrS family protein n=1 Tax=Phenylobacterium sp. TaxID=1871053 RepID=UPI0025FC6834|nr:NnrS family protein [Phenylobacterium sp.]
MTTQEDPLFARRRAKIAVSPPFLRLGFRPFFLLGPAWAVIALVLWLLTIGGVAALPTAFAPLVWHRHEMLFGFVGAVVAGFLLTAIPNWTGRPAIAGWPLGALAGLWAAGRVALLVSAWTGPVAAAVLDVSFYVVLAGLVAREIVAARNRNLPIAGLVLLLGVANGADHAGAAGLLADGDLGIRAALAIMVMMISVVGGRIIPAFTRNWLVKQGIERGLPKPSPPLDLAVLALSAASLGAWTAAPDWTPAGGLLAAAAGLQFLRLSRWSGLRCARDPLVLILHVGYLWIPAGLALLGASLLGAPVPRSAAIHALTVGAMGTMVLAVMTRAILGHTGRELVAGLPTSLIYALVTMGALLRVAASLGLFDYALGMDAAAIAWAGAFILFLVRFGPMLFRPRLDSADGPAVPPRLPLAELGAVKLAPEAAEVVRSPPIARKPPP